MQVSRPTHLHVRRHFLACVMLTEIAVGYARKYMAYLSCRTLLANATNEEILFATVSSAILAAVIENSSCRVWNKEFSVVLHLLF